MTNFTLRFQQLAIFWPGIFLFAYFTHADASDFTKTIELIKPSVVGIGTYQKIRTPAETFVGTGFVVGDGLTVITNAHVVQNLANGENIETLGIIIRHGELTEFRQAALIALDTEHDLAALKITGASLPAMVLGDSDGIREGQEVAFTGFPIGMVLGLHHVTHRGMISALTPIVMPVLDSKKLDVKIISQLRKSPYTVFQLDGTAYPGNSGSPMYDPDTAQVYGVIDKVFVNGLKENAITHPSGITYAIPAKYVRDLINRNK
ncbi:MAG TPA: serine protease [Burkholderiaceae bacterium]|jgi:S1-C subfamily serine protease